MSIDIEKLMAGIGGIQSQSERVVIEVTNRILQKMTMVTTAEDARLGWALGCDLVPYSVMSEAVANGPRIINVPVFSSIESIKGGKRFV